MAKNRGTISGLLTPEEKAAFAAVCREKGETMCSVLTAYARRQIADRKRLNAGGGRSA